MMERFSNCADKIPESKYIPCRTVNERSLCRICLSPGYHLNLSDKSGKEPTVSTLIYLEKLMACVPSLNIVEDDPYPHCICYQCSELLDQAYEFHLLCIRSDQTLRNPIAEVKIEIETKEEPEIEVKSCNNDAKPRKVRKNAGLRDENGKYVRRHKRKAKHKCEICEKMMLSKFALEQHVRTHTGDRPFVCEVCGKSFRTRGCIKNHLESHNMNGPKRFNCTLCPFKAHRAIAFTRHLVVHSTGRPFECDICKGKFKSKITLRNHTKRVHLGKLPMRCCQLCGDKFASRYVLQTHLNIHNSPKQYRCSECKKLYGNFKNLCYHVNKNHPNLGRPKQADVLVDTNDLMKRTGL